MQHIDAGIDLLRFRYHNNPEWFRSDRICFIDTLLCMLWCSSKYDEFVNSADENGLGRRLPAGAYDYHCGELPSYCKSKKVWGLDIDDIYSSLHVKKNHWVAMWVSIPQRHITIWDSTLVHASDQEIAVAATPIANIIPYLLHTLCPREENWKYPNQPFTFGRVKSGVPQNDQSGDCGVYCLKYIEFHALGMEFPSYLCDKNIKSIRDKLASDILHDLKVTWLEKREEYALLDMYD